MRQANASTNAPDPETMERAAKLQAQARANREGRPCFVYRAGDTWFVRTIEEGEPFGAGPFLFVAQPQAEAGPRQGPCACYAGMTCDVSHDPATCRCVQCRTAEARRKR